jgi:hypothetical protein
LKEGNWLVFGEYSGDSLTLGEYKADGLGLADGASLSGVHTEVFVLSVFVY